MAIDPMTPERLKAGGDYLTALKTHGIEPEGMCWALQRERGDLSLVIVSSLVDRVGPLRINDILFKAYDTAITPRSIDPWIVEFFSPDTIFATELHRVMTMIQGPVILNFGDGTSAPAQDPEDFYAVGPYEVRGPWVYVKFRPKPAAERQLKRWEAFAQRVDRAAA